MYNANKIRLEMAGNALTQAELAEKAGCSPGTISRVLLTGNARPETIKKIADALGLSVKDLVNI